MKSTRFTNRLLIAVHVVIGSIILLPLAFVLVSSFRTLDDIFVYMSPVTWKTFLPTSIVLDAYVELFANKGFTLIFFNTFYVAISKVVFGLLVGSLAAFALVQFQFRGKTAFFFLVLFTIMIPFEVMAIPLYTLVDSLGWIDSYKGLIIPGIANGLVIFLYRQFFMDLPSSLSESAHMDGASSLRIYWSIIMPLCKPVTVSAGLLIFIQQWEAFLWPLIATRSDRYRVIQVALSDFTSEFGTSWNELYAASLIAIAIPVLVLVPLQRFFVMGISNSGSKE